MRISTSEERPTVSIQNGRPICLRSSSAVFSGGNTSAAGSRRTAISRKIASCWWLNLPSSARSSLCVRATSPSLGTSGILASFCRAAGLLGAPDDGARVSLPMISRGRLVGWLVADGADGLPPDSADRALLEALASSAAVALDNSRLYLSAIQKNVQLIEIKEQLRSLDDDTRTLAYS